MKFHKGLNSEFTQRPLIFAAEIACTLLSATAIVMLALGLARSLDSLIFHRAEGLVTNVLLLLAGAVLRASLVFIRERLAEHVCTKATLRLRTQLTTHAFELRGHFPTNQLTSDLSNLYASGVEAISPYLRSFYPAYISAAIIPLVIIVVVAYIDLLSAAVFLLTGPLIPLFAALIGMQVAKKSEKQWFALGDLSRKFHDLLRGWDTLRIHNATQSAYQSLEVSGRRYRDATFSVLSIAFLSALSLEFLATISTAIVAVEIGLRLLYGKMPYGEALFVLILAPEFYAPLRNLGGAFHASASGLEAMQRIETFLQHRSPKTEARSAASDANIASTPFPKDWKAISAKNITVSYPTSPQPVLKNVSMELRRGEVLGITGPSGVGKSTLVASLLRNLELIEGQINVDNLPSSEIPLNIWEEQFVFLPQRPTLAHTTLRKNILLGRKNISEDQIMSACNLACLDDLLTQLPNGLDTLVGENGATLSTGQAHRVALARAFLSTAPIIILDEPTAHLDSRTEKTISDAIAELSRHRTLVIIAHRSETIARCHRTISLGTPSSKEIL
jgi:thiol reductant ABC exporter CydD subunit